MNHLKTALFVDPVSLSHDLNRIIIKTEYLNSTSKKTYEKDSKSSLNNKYLSISLTLNYFEIKRCLLNILSFLFIKIN